MNIKSQFHMFFAILILIIFSSCDITSEVDVHFYIYEGEVFTEKAVIGEYLTKPTDSTREGYVLSGWFKDISHTESWNFDEDIVKESMTLYAKWIEEIQDKPILEKAEYNTIFEKNYIFATGIMDEQKDDTGFRIV